MNDTGTRVYCAGCGADVHPRLTTGAEVYPHRADLADLPFWKCDGCGNFVGCHHKSANPTRPLGCIATPELKAARQEIHRTLDPLWKSGAVSRKQAYAHVTAAIGREYHTANVRSVVEARLVLSVVREYARTLPS